MQLVCGEIILGMQTNRQTVINMGAHAFQMLKPALSRNNAKTRFFTIKINTLQA